MISFIYNKSVRLSFNFGGDLILKKILGVISYMDLSLVVLFVVLGVLCLLLISILIFGLIIRSMIKKFIASKINYVDNRVAKQDNKILVLDDAIKSAEGLKSELDNRILKLKTELRDRIVKINEVK